MGISRPFHFQLPPSILYKYCPPERIDILENLTVRFSPPSAFNDTFDTQYGGRATNVKDRFQHQKFRIKLGIVCLTETADDPLMWAHYAGNHTGFVIGFDSGASFFTDDGRQLGPVHYTELERVNVPRMSLDDLSLCFYKAPDWQTEREWRCVRKFESSESRLVFLGPEPIRQIIVGYKADAALIGQLVRHVALNEISDVQFFLSTPDKALWRFNHFKKAYSLCQNCTGQGYIEAQK